MALNQKLQHFEIDVLDIVDVVVTKFKRFGANDKSDIEAMVDLNLAPHNKLVERFRSAVDNYLMDANSYQIPNYVRKLNQVERDMLLVDSDRIAKLGWPVNPSLG